LTGGGVSEEVLLFEGKPGKVSISTEGSIFRGGKGKDPLLLGAWSVESVVSGLERRQKRKGGGKKGKLSPNRTKGDVYWLTTERWSITEHV